MPVVRAAFLVNVTSVSSATTLTSAPSATRVARPVRGGTPPPTPCSVYSPESIQVRAFMLHTVIFPMLCIPSSCLYNNNKHEVVSDWILSSSLSDLYFGGENHSAEHTTSFTCPLCGQVGFSEVGLRDHVTKQHSDPSMLQEVICPVCASHPSGDPNHLTDDLPTHLTMEHRAFREMEISSCQTAFKQNIHMYDMMKGSLGRQLDHEKLTLSTFRLDALILL